MHMVAFITYMIKVNFALAVLYLLYKLFFSRDKFFYAHRVVLLLIYAVAFTIPFIDLPEWRPGNETAETIVETYRKLVPVISETTLQPETGWLLLAVLAGIASVSFILFIKMALGIFLICRKIIKIPVVTISGIKVRSLLSKEEPHSFFRWICVYPEGYEQGELYDILLHEQVHVKQWHSIDIIIAQVVTCIGWYNPFVWLLRSEIRMNHEFMADEGVLRQGVNKKEYQYNLLGFDKTREINMAAANLYNNFSVLPLKKRIKMLNKKKTSNIGGIKYLMLVPVIGLLLMLNNTRAMSTAKDAIADSLPIETIGETFGLQTADTVVTSAFVMPQFPGGETELKSYITKNLKYPVDASEKKIQGRVIVKFIVEKDGSVNQVEVLKSVDPSLDKESVRVIKSMPKWIPGKNKSGMPQRVWYTVPIDFSLVVWRTN
ncbi:M56 family metallopeptidase [Coprobacter tertius]|uniref:M56 family metallopeptidase n=1 Tax=Coprobacter tertius TaxID=2944915 RepID=A0ABT1MFJ1_9BACT|nr:M56 family metallopeptidase [Coprobacter tertius]MCP9611400.1 M56 family metallopeptidase [Coprobacter tertius]